MTILFIILGSCIVIYIQTILHKELMNKLKEHEKYFSLLHRMLIDLQNPEMAEVFRDLENSYKEQLQIGKKL